MKLSIFPVFNSVVDWVHIKHSNICWCHRWKKLTFTDFLLEITDVLSHWEIIIYKFTNIWGSIQGRQKEHYFKVDIFAYLFNCSWDNIDIMCKCSNPTFADLKFSDLWNWRGKINFIFFLLIHKYILNSNSWALQNINTKLFSQAALWNTDLPFLFSLCWHNLLITFVIF